MDPNDTATRALFAGVWQHREAIEWQAAGLFSSLTQALESLRGPEELTQMAHLAARDEIEHAGLCAGLVRHLAPQTQTSALPQSPERPAEQLASQPAPKARRHSDELLGPTDLSIEQRVLYTSLALSCVTETLSTALLIEMKAVAEDGLVSSTVARILKDEVNHSKIGWAHLAWAAERSDVRWLGEHVPDMVRASLEAPPIAAKFDWMLAENFGILGPERASTLTRETLLTVIIPGLQLYSIETDEVRRLADGTL